MGDESTIASSNLKQAVILTQNDGIPGSQFEEDPENYTVEQLKRWLKCRSLKLSGKRSDLLARVRDAIKAGNHHVLDPSIDDGKWLQAKILKETKTTDRSSARSEDVTIPIAPKSGWKAFPSQDIPSLFNYGHVYHYALESLPFVSNENDSKDEHDVNNLDTDTGLGHMTDKPFSVGRKYVDSGFVHDLTDNKTTEHYFVKAHVWPSMKTDLPHNVDITLSRNSGAVIHASCQPCKASALGRCSHVVAVLLFLVDYVKTHGSQVTTPCTSQECSWNNGKKRQKNPRKLSDAKYPTKRKQRKLQVIDFDPRPKEYRKITDKNINNFVVGLQTISAEQKHVSMWETQLLINYEDYTLEPSAIPILEKKAEVLLSNITPTILTEIEGTRSQSNSEKWFSERWCRITASTCFEAHKIGLSIISNDSNAAKSCSKFISAHIWNINNNQRPQTKWMKYGLESEAEAVIKYQQQTNSVVSSTGLWVNPEFPYIACSPDGLIGDDGLLEIKSLKIFHDYTIDRVINGNGTLISKDTLNRQCFRIQDEKCVLKKSHSYYFQVQCQLLVTEREFCDFVLYAKDGPISIQRIYRDEQLITEIFSSVTALWKRVIAPEVFEMRVPRDLEPFVMSNSFIASSNALFDSPPDNTSGSTDIPSDDCGSTFGYPENSNCCSSPPGYTADEVEIATMLTTCTSYISRQANLIVIPWGGKTSNGVEVTNTCPIDNWLMIFQSLTKSGRVVLDDMEKAGDLLKTALQLVDRKQFADAKVLFILNPAVKNGVLDCYGNEADYVIRELLPFLATTIISTCNLSTCPSMRNVYTSYGISLGSNGNDVSFNSSLREWLLPAATPCQRRFHNKPASNTPSQPNVTLHCDGTQSVSWHCSGFRITSPRFFSCFKNIAIFSVDLLSRRFNLKFHDLPPIIDLNNKQLTLHSVTLWNGGHYICILNHLNTWFVYDGLKEYQSKNSGLSVFAGQPSGYLLSHVIYVV